LFDAELVGFAAADVDVEVVDGDAAVRGVFGDVGVFAEQAADIAIGLGEVFVRRRFP